MAEALRETKRSFDSAARVGGEEFAILAPDTDEHGAYILAERMRGRDRGRPSATPRCRSRVSFGIVSFPLHGQTADGLLQAGDQALYAAKRLGRNRSVISSAEVPGILARAPRGHEGDHVELAMLLNLAEALDVRDTGNATHCHRVARFAELIARELGLPPRAVERVRIAGILHDVGRVGVPDALFRKSGPLSEEEWAFVRSHPEVGARMVETTEFEEIGDWIHAHHERPDGRGYPDGLARRGRAARGAHPGGGGRLRGHDERALLPARARRRAARRSSCGGAPAASSTSAWSRRSCGSFSRGSSSCSAAGRP